MEYKINYTKCNWIASLFMAIMVASKIATKKTVYKLNERKKKTKKEKELMKTTNIFARICVRRSFMSCLADIFRLLFVFFD